jgi:hypothetical protein
LKLYCISGLGADKRVFKYLKLNAEVIALDWIEPNANEAIEIYSKRLSTSINTSEPFGILGVSFGGLIATEISKQLNPEITILISSAETKNELRTLFNFVGHLGILRLLPEKLFDIPRPIAKWLFGTDKTELLYSILDNTDLKFAKWAVIALTNWKNKTRLKSKLKIGGENDKLIPSQNSLESITIKNGEHFMIVDKANEISELINSRIKNGT